MLMLPLRLMPGQDLRRALEETVQTHGHSAAFVLSAIGSLSEAQVRFAGAANTTVLTGKLELLSLSGSIAATGAHLHGALATDDGTVLGGHLAYGCLVRTTAEVLLGLLPDWHFTRETDAATGYPELVVQPKSPTGD
jgi:uncharacterized protein